jgi:dihydrofolate reductase
MTVKAIWAQNVAGVIGLRNRLPWSVPEDLTHFKKMTVGSTVVMGRKTWDSLPPSFRPLKGRRNLVLTRDTGWESEGAVPVHSVHEAVVEASKLEHGVDGDLWVIGGSEIYNLFLPHVAEVVLTVVHADIAGDAYAPTLPDSFSRVSASERLTSRTGLLYEFTVLARQEVTGSVPEALGENAVEVDASAAGDSMRTLSDPAVRRALFSEVREEARADRAERRKAKNVEDGSSVIETSPSGVGFVRPASKKAIEGEPESAVKAKRRSWLKK